MSVDQRETIGDQPMASNSHLSFQSFIKKHLRLIGYVLLALLLSGTMAVSVGIVFDNNLLTVIGSILIILLFLLATLTSTDNYNEKTKRVIDESVTRYEAYREQARIDIAGDTISPSSNRNASDIAESQKISDFEKTVNNMMENNATMTRVFQENTMSDNRSAFRLSAGICIAGLSLLGIIVSLTAMGLINSSVALVSGVAGAIAELGSGISLVLHQRASARTSRYFDALHENERVLYSMNMMLQISDAKARNDALSKAAVSLASGVINEQKSTTATK